MTDPNIHLTLISKSDPGLRYAMLAHYSEIYGFVGRQLIYAVTYGPTTYGYIAAGSATRYLPGRSTFLDFPIDLRNIVNNTFFHIERQGGVYPCRNFIPQIMSIWRYATSIHWPDRYGDQVLAFEALVQLPRTGDLYLRDGWTEVGLTQGFTCRRMGGGASTDTWTGRRLWSRSPDPDKRKRVFMRLA